MTLLPLLVSACLVTVTLSHPFELSERSPATIGPAGYGQDCGNVERANLRSSLRICSELATAAAADALNGANTNR